jgi:tRNA(Ile)-lysidine synthase
LSVGPDPAVAAVRLAVRRGLPVVPDGAGGRLVPGVDGDAVLVACSGGADSLALLAATVFELRGSGVRVVGVVVDHGLQADSGEHTTRVVDQMAALGADETASVRVTVDPGPRGVEAGARHARYVALTELAQHFGAGLVLLGHTRDDQAETVLLGLTQGSGPRSLSGMRRRFGGEDGGADFLRPLLDLTREQTQAACRATGIAWWDDPHNVDPRFVRSRARNTVMPMLERELGPGVAAALARTGHLVRDDLDALDDLAEAEARRHDFAGGVDVRRLATFPVAVRSRVLRSAVLAAGCPPREVTQEHLRALDDTVTRPRGEPRELDLPGHLAAVRRGEVLRLVPRPSAGQARAESRDDAGPPPVAG